MQYYGLISGHIALEVLAETELIFLAFFLLLLIITRHANRSFQLTTLIGFIALFYGVIKDFFKETVHINFLARYVVLLALLVVLLVFLGWRILKKQDFRKTNLFQNLLLILFIVVDAVPLLRLGGPVFMQKNLLVKNDIINPDTLAVPASRPDVYFLVFDSYPGTGFLRDYVQYDNTPFNTELQNRGFHIIAHPKSNYNRTAFSISSTLNFEYLHTIANNKKLEPRQYNQAKLSVEHAIVPRVFVHCGYKLYNLSVFDLANNPAILKETFLTFSEKQVLLYNTLAERVKRDILWHFSNGPSEKEIKDNGNLFISRNLAKRDFNNSIIDSLFKLPGLPTATPKFIYAHFYLPHPPFFYDSTGKSRDRTPREILMDMENKAAVIDYLKYTNKVILHLVDTLLHNQATPPIIIVQSDHGYRDFRQSEVNPHLYFNNYSAFYFPNNNYSALYDTLSNINTFPLIFNGWFNTHIPLQKDSVVFTPYPD